MKKMSHYLHPKQILTTRREVKACLSWRAYNTARAILRCLTLSPEDPEYLTWLYVAASSLERISCPVYRDKDGLIRKLKEKDYRKEIFEGWAETPEEVYDRTKEYGVTPEGAVLIHKEMWQIADLVCPKMACATEHGFISEYAYDVDYVIRHKGDLPKPEIRLLFPQNYEDYHYTEGVAKEIGKYEFM